MAKTLKEIVADAIEEALVRNNNNRVHAARELGIGKTTLYRHLARAKKRKPSPK